jgi:hypothetical protein
MKKPRFKERQIFQVLKESEAGVPVPAQPFSRLRGENGSRTVP